VLQRIAEAAHDVPGGTVLECEALRMVWRCRYSVLKRAWFQRLKLKCDEPLSNFAFKFNLRRYSMTGHALIRLRSFEPAVEPARCCSPRHHIQCALNPRVLNSTASYDVASVTDNARHVIQCALNPRLLSSMASYDVASDICQA